MRSPRITWIGRLGNQTATPLRVHTSEAVGDGRARTFGLLVSWLESKVNIYIYIFVSCFYLKMYECMKSLVIFVALLEQ